MQTWEISSHAVINRMNETRIVCRRIERREEEEEEMFFYSFDTTTHYLVVSFMWLASRLKYPKARE